MTVGGGLYLEGHAVLLEVTEPTAVGVAMLTPAKARKIADDLYHAAWQLEQEIRETKRHKEPK